MSQTLPEEWFIKNASVNAVLAWVLTALLGVTAALHFLFGSLVVVGIAATATVVAVVPAVVLRSWRRTVPWPLLALAVLALLVGFGPSFLGDTIVALAMLVVVTLQLTTPVRMTPDFAIGFVVIATLGTAGLWALGSAASARYLGTSFVETNEQLMIVFTATLLASLVAGVVFRWYFRRQLAANLASDADTEVTP